MTDKVGGILEVGINGDNEVVINHPDLKPDKDGVGHIIFSAKQAKNLADLLLKQVKIIEQTEKVRAEEERIKSIPPVDRSKRQLLDGSPVPDDYSHTETQSNGQQKSYVVLSDEERQKGFIRRVRRSYIHETCGSLTTMGLALAETYARDPKFYSGTFCCACGKHFPLDQFHWADDGEKVGS